MFLQGISLTMIIKEVPTEHGHRIVILIQKLKKLIDDKTQDEGKYNTLCCL